MDAFCILVNQCVVVVDDPVIGKRPVDVAVFVGNGYQLFSEDGVMMKDLAQRNEGAADVELDGRARNQVNCEYLIVIEECCHVTDVTE